MEVLNVEGGGKFMPKSGVGLMANSPKLAFSEGKVEVTLELAQEPIHCTGNYDRFPLLAIEGSLIENNDTHRTRGGKYGT